MRAALDLRTIVFVLSLLMSLAPTTWLAAQHDAADFEPPSITSLEPPEKPFERPPHLVVVRISAKVLGQRFDQRIDCTTPVRDYIFDTPVTGVARMVGQPRVELVPSSDQARFSVVFSGTVYSKTVGHGGPATIYGHSITTFTATKEVIFEPGKGFQSLPPKIASTTRCYTDSIATSRGGLIGRIIQRRASEEIAAKQTQLTAIARDRATRRVAAAFDHQLNDRIAHLNESVDFQVKLAGLRTREGSRRLMACTSPQYLQISDMIYKGKDSPVNLPPHESLVGATAPIEVWVHKSVVPKKIATQLKTVFDSPDQSAVVNGLALLPGAIGKEAAAAITALAAQHTVGLENVGDWLVIDINATTKATASPAVAGRPIRPANTQR
jgi:hypothetical protein